MLGVGLPVAAEPVSAPVPVFQPQIGDRVEVKWTIFDDETGETEIKWWGAKVLRKVEGKQDAAGRAVFTLSYDAEEGFESDEQDVSFVDEHGLVEDGGDGAVMPWRKEGDDWEDAPAPKKRRTQPPPESDYEDELEDDEEEAAADEDDEDEYNPHADE